MHAFSRSRRLTRPSIFGPGARFLLAFAVLAGALTFLFQRWLWPSRTMDDYLKLNASLVGALLNVLGERVTTSGRFITGDSFTLEVIRGCDGIQAMILFASATLAFPCSWRPRALGVVAGAALLFVLNTVRLLNLYWVGSHWRDAFETVHIDLWQFLFMAVTVLLWTVWVVNLRLRAR